MKQVLDSSQYSLDSIQHYECVYGKDFVSPGGVEMARELIGKLDLQPNQRVLDVGCGLGGSAFLMAREFGFYVDGIDLSENMLALASKKLADYGLSDRVKLQQGDCLKLRRSQQYDAVYSRDVFLHVHEKQRLFSVLKSTLRPGGRLLFTDYCCGPQPWSDEFSVYVKDRGYFMQTLSGYVQLVETSGFKHVQAVDLTSRFVDILNSDIERIGSLPLDQSTKSKMEQGWRGKLARAEVGDHRWGLVMASV